MARSSGPLLVLQLFFYVIWMGSTASALMCIQCDQRLNNTDHCLNGSVVNCALVTGVANTSYHVCVKILTKYYNGQFPWVQSGCNLVTRFNGVGSCDMTPSIAGDVTTCTCNNVDYCNGIGGFEPASVVALVLTAVMLVAMQRV
uniref:Protein quiver n=1 Tax=Plectus sambesii TaxID=2011161 RepID=A0A914W900_9BILA